MRDRGAEAPRSPKWMFVAVLVGNEWVKGRKGKESGKGAGGVHYIADCIFGGVDTGVEMFDSGCRTWGGCGAVTGFVSFCYHFIGAGEGEREGEGGFVAVRACPQMVFHVHPAAGGQ